VRERAAGLPQREIERRRLERPAPVVGVRGLVGIAAGEELERVEPRRERGERPLLLEEELRKAVPVLLGRVRDVLPEPLVPAADEVNDGRLARELGRDRERERLGLDGVDLDREVPDGVVQHSREPIRGRAPGALTAVRAELRAVSTQVTSCYLRCQARPTLGAAPGAPAARRGARPTRRRSESAGSASRGRRAPTPPAPPGSASRGAS